MGFRSAPGTLLGKHGTGLPPARSRSHSRFHHARPLMGPWSGLLQVALATFTALAPGATPGPDRPRGR